MDPFPRSPDPDEGPPVHGGLPSGSDPPALSQAEPGFFARCVALFTAPRNAFRAPRGLTFWLIPLIVILAVTVVDSVLLGDLYNEQIIETIESNRSFSDEQRTLILDTLEAKNESGTTVSSILQTTVGAIVNEALAFFLLGLFYMFGVNFGLAGQARYLDVVGVLALSWMALVPRVLLTLPLKLSQGTLDIHTGPAALVSHQGGWLPTILGFFDLFDLFRLFLITVGLSVVGGVKTSRSVILVVAFWLLGCGFQIAWKMGPFGGMTP